MGVTFVTAKISNSSRPERGSIELEFLLDTGALYSVIPSVVARKLALRKLGRQEFRLADGTRISYDVSEAMFQLEGKRGTSGVVFGPAEVTPILGAMALQSFGLMLNPVTRELSRMRLMLALLEQWTAHNPL